jgi:hypothetical protein
MKKSKFLKKSLAMLLALMLVVAMIPLSASAAELPNLTMIYVNGQPVEVSGSTFTADIDTNDSKVTLATNEDLDSATYNAKLEVKSVKSTLSKKLVDVNDGTLTDPKFDFSFEDYGTVTTSDVTMNLVLTSTTDSSLTQEFTLVLNKTDKNTTTNLKNAVKVDGTGVYSVDVNNAARTVEVVAARNTSYNNVAVTVYTDENAKINGATSYKVTGDGNKFEVVSESGNNKAEYTLKVVEIADALTGFSINGVEGVITDENPADKTPDTVTVTLTKDMVQNEYGEYIDKPKLPVTFSTYGNNATVEITGVETSPKTIKSGESLEFDGLTTPTGTPNASADITSGASIKVSCEGVDQTYNLKVVFVKDSDTTISYAQLNKQIATIDGNKITAELPAADDLSQVEVILHTATTVKSVTVGNNSADKGSVVNGLQQWKFDASGSSQKLNLTSSKIITITSENNAIQHYNISATKASNVSDAYLTAMTLKNGDVEYKGTIDRSKHTVTFTVPYMTLDIEAWKVFATPIAGANVDNGSGTVVVNGTTIADDLWTKTDLDVTVDENGDPTNTGTTKVGTIRAVNKTDTSVEEKYDVIVNLANSSNGNKLSSLTVTSQVVANDTDKEVFRAISTDNTVKGDIKYDSVTGNKIVLSPAFSLAQSGYHNVVTGFTTENGGVAFLKDETNSNYSDYGVTLLTATTSDKDVPLTGDTLSEADDHKTIIVLPEEIAREALAAVTVPGNNATVSASDVATYGTVYTIDVDPQEASHNANLKTFKFGNTTLTVSGNKITGTLPYSSTFVDGTFSTPAENVKADFAEFTLDKYAAIANFASNGDTTGDGEPEGVGSTNLKFAFVQDTDHKVKVYSYDGSNFNSLNNKITVEAEDRLTTGDKSAKTYTFELTYADPCGDADITSFKLANSNGVISGSGEKRSINVTVPYGTDLKGLVPTFTTSIGASVKIGDISGTTLESGKTSVNFSDPVKLYVTSEDTKLTVEYTVTVKAADQFTDVRPGDWFYENVMRAVELGIAKGKGNGIFDPYGNITRRDFAIMLAQAMGQSNDGEAVSPFPDVADDDYGVVSIAFLYDKGITVGDNEGNFNPDANITRQEVAIFMAKAFGATGTTSETFTDDAKIASWAKSFVYAAKAAGLMNGDANGAFRPTSTLTRAEAASVMVNAVDK